jgi:multicomponent Na+:H+ antiporter subunit F
MTTIAVLCLVILVACMFACFYRMAIGPHALDRLLASSVNSVLVTVVVAVFAIIQESWVYLEISMGLAVLSFVGTVTIAQYIERRRIF